MYGKNILSLQMKSKAALLDWETHQIKYNSETRSWR